MLELLHWAVEHRTSLPEITEAYLRRSMEPHTTPRCGQVYLVMVWTRLGLYPAPRVIFKSLEISRSTIRVRHACSPNVGDSFQSSVRLSNPWRATRCD